MRRCRTRPLRRAELKVGQFMTASPRALSCFNRGRLLKAALLLLDGGEAGGVPLGEAYETLGATAGEPLEVCQTMRSHL